MQTIVVIEEDSAMRTLICEWLLGEGYAVSTRRANEAMPAGHDNDVGLVIVDLPNLRSRGAETIRTVRARYPHSALIGLSAQLGRSMPGDSDAARALGLPRLVAKPCGRGELLDAVSESMGMPPPPA
ncbi:response regulator [Variovorax sp. JS1663]|uniref:response regulator n=1 Tax=Variovorax sp. JS1663 TaxID=1851577 RepID=UPI001302354D|nr:response regulator [Variovorax sp. JS1663]